MTKDEMMLIAKIAERADENGLMMFDRVSLILDIKVADEQYGLRLEELLNADDYNFAHDIIGIQQNIDRGEKVIKNLFLPRYAK